MDHVGGRGEVYITLQDNGRRECNLVMLCSMKLSYEAINTYLFHYIYICHNGWTISTPSFKPKAT